MSDVDHQSKAALSLSRALMNTSQLPLVLFDGDLRVVSATPSFYADFNLLRDETDGGLLADLGNGEWNMPPLRALLKNALLAEPKAGDCETDLVRPGVGPRRLIVHVQNLVYDDKRNTRVLLTVNDVTDVRHAARLNTTLLLEKDNLLRERDILLQEMQHRVANSLQIIASVLLLKARNVKSEETRLHLQDAHDRVMSVAAVQQHLQASLGDVEVAPYLTKLCESLASSMIRESRPVALNVRSDKATITSHDAVSLGLIVTELVINALKHAFPDGRSGIVAVDYRVKPAGWVLSVTDNGIGRQANAPAVKGGLGTSIVNSLAQQQGARVVISDAAPGARISVVSDVDRPALMPRHI